jgi:hypothetical protein
VTRRRALAQAAPALFAGGAYDPSAEGGFVAWQRPDGSALLQRGAAISGLPGRNPAVGGGRIAWHRGDAIVIAAAATLGERARRSAPGAGVLAISSTLLAWRVRDAAGTDRLWVQADGGSAHAVLAVAAPGEIGRPAIVEGRVLCHVAGPGGSRLMAIDPATGAQEPLREEPGAQITNPSSDGSLLLYVHATGRAQELRLGTLEPLDPADDEILAVLPSSGRRDREHEPGRRRHKHQGVRPPLPPRAQPGVLDTIWATALTPESAFFTRIRVQRGLPRSADIVRVAILA